MLKLLKFRKLFASVFIVLYLLSLIIAPAAKAQNIWYDQSYDQWYSKVYDSPGSEIFGERYTAAQVQWVVYGFWSFISNLLGGNNDATRCVIRAKGNAENECKGELTSAMNNLFLANNPGDSVTPGGDTVQKATAVFSTNPVSFVSYVANIRDRLSIIPGVQAQEGTGFGALNPVIELWRVSRNLSYLFLTIVIIALAFMIMFRVKISPQTVINVQSALPKIVVALILITFSYAIAGFLIDLMYVAIFIVAMAFTTLSGGNLSNYNALDMFNHLIDLNFVSTLFTWNWLFGIGALLSPFTLSLGNWFTNIFLFIFSLVVPIIVIFLIFKIIFMLLKNYVQIILLVTVAPLQILFGVVSPQAGFGSWLRNMLSHLLVYPLTAVMLLLSFLFLVSGFPDWLTNDIAIPFTDLVFDNPGRGLFFGFRSLGSTAWNPPMTLGSGNEALIYLLISFVIVTMIPKTVEIIQSLVQGKPFAYGTAVGEATGIITGPASGAAKGWWERVAGTYLSALGSKAGTMIPERPGGSLS